MSVRFFFPIIASLGILLSCAAGAVRAQESFIISLTARSSASTAAVKFGYHENATYCLERELGDGLAEVELPPPPPDPFWIDMRFVATRAGMGGCTVYNEMGMGSFINVHGWESALQDTFALAVLNAETGYAVELAWEGAQASRLQAGSTLVMQDPFGGVLVNVDMLAHSSVELPPGLSSLMIYAHLSARGGIPLPQAYALGQNYPNPFNPLTHLQFTIVNLQFVSLKVYNILGGEVAVLLNEEKAPGEYTIPWNAGGLPSGVYYYTLRAGEFTESKKLVIVR